MLITPLVHQQENLGLSLFAFLYKSLLEPNILILLILAYNQLLLFTWVLVSCLEMGWESADSK